MTKDLTNKQLMEEVTDALIHGDEAQSVYGSSKHSKELLSKGKAVLNEIGRYLQNLKPLLAKCDQSEKVIIEQGWIILFCDIVAKEKIDILISYDNFNAWVEWAINFKD